ncbi:flagellum-specific ATP synthase [Sulfurihydrogenibium azorense Az-Fu1]|uniref:Flagellum-specific ATP synthase n=1 Tax=Sulfurihydrogenibium azorense (strain DSM 15241 / OCM 825 / Az-Fu1) TaxID=204536 RepID=C1DW28_SULAA|nr:FliI/YscN family ATPase [Sulfurihydrogenibium azorense]ACN98287.1 flagellum-specific ATP synthase [Sulfurihydrogenibium azorense Az-Fu1]MDM7273757.1 FliI/YscN family ATPase [Sulfurihydrogenibium azorense]
MRLKERLKSYPKYKIIGKVKKIKGNTIEAVMPEVSIGDVCFINGKIESQVVGFNDNYTILMTYEDVEGVKVDSPVVLSYTKGNVLVGDDLLGSILDPFGKPLNRENINYSNSYYLKLESINPLERERIKEVLDVGVKVINALITIGKGQRVGILAPAGVGKSTLLGMIARYTDADVNVIALIGERGREVKEFIEDNLGEEGLKKSVVVVATSDMSPLAKIRAVLTSLTIAKYFSDKGKNVLYLLDSLTRVAMAQREIGLSAGEPPTTKGYTPSVFTLMPKIIEQAGNFKGKGSITGIYTVLIEGEEISTDPVADAAVSFLDGHIFLSRQIANKRIYPAVDILKSISRLMPQLVNDEIMNYQRIIINLESKYRDMEDMINLGLYKEGSSKEIDIAIKMHPIIEDFIRQSINEKFDFNSSVENLKKVIEYYLKMGGEIR